MLEPVRRPAASTSHESASCGLTWSEYQGSSIASSGGKDWRWRHRLRLVDHKALVGWSLPVTPPGGLGHVKGDLWSGCARSSGVRTSWPMVGPASLAGQRRSTYTPFQHLNRHWIAFNQLHLERLCKIT